MPQNHCLHNKLFMSLLCDFTPFDIYARWAIMAHIRVTAKRVAWAIVAHPRPSFHPLYPFVSSPTAPALTSPLSWDIYLSVGELEFIYSPLDTPVTASSGVIFYPCLPNLPSNAPLPLLMAKTFSTPPGTPLGTTIQTTTSPSSPAPSATNKNGAWPRSASIRAYRIVQTTPFGTISGAPNSLRWGGRKSESSHGLCATATKPCTCLLDKPTRSWLDRKKASMSVLHWTL